LRISTICDNEATATAYTVAGSTIETITTLGTYAAPTATKCRFKEVDATNHPGVYEIQLAAARVAVSGAKELIISVSGSTTNLVQQDISIPLDFQATLQANAITQASFAVDSGFRAARSGTAQAGATNTLTLDASASAVDDRYNDMLLTIVSGAGSVESKFVTDYNGTTKVATVHENWTVTPDNTSVFLLTPTAAISSPTAADYAAAVAAFVLSGQQTSGTLSATISALNTALTAVKVKTDGLNYDGTYIQAAVKRVNSTTITGNGSTVPWGPV
jgi:predicted DNA-binding ArsR family transcriptional regulator